MNIKTYSEWELREYITDTYGKEKWYSFYGWYKDEMDFLVSPRNQTKVVSNGVIADKITVKVINYEWQFEVERIVEGG